MPEEENVIVRSMTVTIDHLGQLHYAWERCTWLDAIQLLEVAKLCIFNDNMKDDKGEVADGR